MTAATPEARDYRKLRRLAHDLLRQCDAYERHTAAEVEDSARAALVKKYTTDIARVGDRMYGRYLKSRGEQVPRKARRDQ